MKRLSLKLFPVAILILLLTAALEVPSSHVSGSTLPNASRTNSVSQGQTTYGYTCVAYIPADWGEFKGGNQSSGLAFQDKSGTIRFVTNLPCNATPQPALEVRRTQANTN